MDPSRFDDALRTLTLSTRRSRRGVLALLGALTGLSVDEGLARRRLHGQGVQAEVCRTLNQSCTRKQPQLGKRRKCCSGLVVPGQGVLRLPRVWGGPRVL